MEGYYQIGEAARRAGVTIETLRHYDRIGLVKPGRVDGQTGYRYYSDTEIARVQIIKFLRSVKLPLSTIGRLFSEDDIEAATEILRMAQDKVDEEMEHLVAVRQNLQEMLDNYSSKRNTRAFVRALEEPVVQALPGRTIFLAEGLNGPSLENLMQFYHAVEAQISPQVRADFQFENAVGGLFWGEDCVLFATCIRAGKHPQVASLPAGEYLCVSSSGLEYGETAALLCEIAREQYGVEDPLVLFDVIFTGIVQWEYEVKVFLGERGM